MHCIGSMGPQLRNKSHFILVAFVRSCQHFVGSGVQVVWFRTDCTVKYHPASYLYVTICVHCVLEP